MHLSIGAKNFLHQIALVTVVGLPLSGCVTMSSVTNQRENLVTLKSKWIDGCLGQAKQVTLKYGVLKKVDGAAKMDADSIKNSRKEDVLKKIYSYANNLENRGNKALASLDDHNCKPNVLWYSFNYPDCMQQAESRIKKLVESGCYLEEFVAEVKEYKRQMDRDLESAKEKELDAKRRLDHHVAFIAELEKSQATHVLLGLHSGQDGKTCDEQIDGSFICESGAVCDKAGYIKSIRDEFSGKKPARFDSYCDSDSASSRNFFLVAKEKIKFTRYQFYGHIVIPVVRGRNTVMTNGFGARFPAASWLQVSPQFDPTNNKSLAH